VNNSADTVKRGGGVLGDYASWFLESQKGKPSSYGGGGQPPKGNSYWSEEGGKAKRDFVEQKNQAEKGEGPAYIRSRPKGGSSI